MALPEYITKMIKDAKVGASLLNLDEGEYAAAIWALTVERRKGREKLGRCVWVDFRIAHAGEGSKTKVGAWLDHPIALEGQYADMAATDVKRLIMAVSGCSSDEAPAKADEIMAFVDDAGVVSNGAQPARGTFVGIRTRPHEVKSGKNKGKTKHYPMWDHVPGQTAEEIAASRRELEAQRAAEVKAKVSK